jgi:hypothetical protein
MDGSAVLLSDEQITVRDDNYFPSPPTSPSPVPVKTLSAASTVPAVTPNGASGTISATPDAQKDSATATAQARAAAEAKAADAERAMEEHNQLLINSMSLIEWDLPRTYPTLGTLSFTVLCVHGGSLLQCCSNSFLSVLETCLQ